MCVWIIANCRMLCFVIINSVAFNLLCVWIRANCPVLCFVIINSVPFNFLCVWIIANCRIVTDTSLQSALPSPAGVKTQIKFLKNVAEVRHQLTRVPGICHSQLSHVVFRHNE